MVSYISGEFMQNFDAFLLLLSGSEPIKNEFRVVNWLHHTLVADVFHSGLISFKLYI